MNSALEPMPSQVGYALTAMARLSPSREICGIIMKDWSVHIVQNVAIRNDRFEMDEEQLLEIYQKSYRDILGVYHSHPNGQNHPSDADEVYARPGWRYWIVTFEEVHEWEMKNGRLVLVE